MAKRRRPTAEPGRRTGALAVAAGLTLGAYAAATAALRWRTPR